MKRKSDFKGSVRAFEGSSEAVPEAKPRYCLYSRKSTESEERQVLSIDSKIKEMLRLAEREGLDVAEIRRESHSAKDTGQRPVFNELIKDIRSGRFNASRQDQNRRRRPRRAGLCEVRPAGRGCV